MTCSCVRQHLNVMIGENKNDLHPSYSTNHKSIISYPKEEKP